MSTPDCTWVDYYCFGESDVGTHDGQYLARGNKAEHTTPFVLPFATGRSKEQSQLCDGRQKRSCTGVRQTAVLDGQCSLPKAK
jgi:hypothetical protein